MSLILDATAGNRAMWRKKNPPIVVFMDKETGLSRPPHIFAAWQNLPFRDHIFRTVLFDPPHEKFGKNSIHRNPQGWANPRIVDGRRIGGTFWGSLPGDWVDQFSKAAHEFSRVAFRLCLKWNNSKYPLDRVLSLFIPLWRIIQTKRHFSSKRVGKTKTFWVTMDRAAREEVTGV